MSTVLRFAAVVLCSITLAGCNTAYRYHARGTVKDAVTGTSLNRVEIELLDVDNLSYRDWVTGVWTDSYGYFRMQFHIDRYESDATRKWKLKLSATGYEDEIVEIGPVDQPSSGDPVYLILRVFLRPKGDPPEAADQ